MTILTNVVGRECDSLHRALFSGPQGQYLLSASEAEKGMVAARARSVTARLKIRRLRGVRTCKSKVNGKLINFTTHYTFLDGPYLQSMIKHFQLMVVAHLSYMSHKEA